MSKLGQKLCGPYIFIKTRETKSSTKKTDCTRVILAYIFMTTLKESTPLSIELEELASTAHSLFFAHQEGLQLTPRWEVFSPREVGDMNVFTHVLRQQANVKNYPEPSLTPEERRIIEIAFWIHDLGEEIVGDVRWDKKGLSHELNEVNAMLQILNDEITDEEMRSQLAGVYVGIAFGVNLERLVKATSLSEKELGVKALLDEQGYNLARLQLASLVAPRLARLFNCYEQIGYMHTALCLYVTLKKEGFFNNPDNVELAINIDPDDLAERRVWPEQRIREATLVATVVSGKQMGLILRYHEEFESPQIFLNKEGNDLVEAIIRLGIPALGSKSGS